MRGDDLLEEEITNAVLELEQERLIDLINTGLDENISTLKMVNAIVNGLSLVGKKYEEKEYFLMELILSGEAAKAGMDLLGPYLEADDIKPVGKVVIGTVANDTHDIGKNIVTTMLRSVGFQVIDLGIEVTAEEFIEAIEREKPDILSLSALLMTTIGEIDTTISKIKEAGVRDRVKILIGGRPITDDYARKAGADGYARDGIEAIEVAKKLVGAHG